MRIESMSDWVDIMCATSALLGRTSNSSSPLRMRFTIRLSRSRIGSV